MRASPLLRFSVAFVAAGALSAGAACVGDDAQFEIKYAPDFARRSTSVSVFGIFKDGRMSPESWDNLGPRLLASLGKGRCETAYSEDFIARDPLLVSAVDDYARANGVTDELLDQFGPAARGDTIMLITVAGHPPQRLGDGGAPAQRAPARQPAMRGGFGGRRPMSTAADRPTTDRSVFDVSASLFSVRLHRSVAQVSMTYSGPSAEVALQRFAERLGTELPGAGCRGWNREVRIGEGTIRKIAEQ